METALSILMLWSLLLAVVGAGAVLWVAYHHHFGSQAVRRSRVLTGRSAAPRELTAKELAVFAELQSERARLEREQQELRDKIRAAITPPMKPPAARPPEARR